MEGHDGAEEAAAAAAAAAATAVHEHPSEWSNLTDDEREVLISSLVQQRGMTEAKARGVVMNSKCEECTCSLGVEVSEDTCMCSCHCLCCCAPLFRCRHECACSCECHYEAIEETDSGEESDESSDSENQIGTSADSFVSATPSDVDEQEQTKTVEDTVPGAGETPGAAAQSEPTSHGDTAKPPGLAENGVTTGEASTAAADPAVGSQKDDTQHAQADQSQLPNAKHKPEVTNPISNDQTTDQKTSPEDQEEQHGDEDMMKAPELPTTWDDRSTGQIYHLLQEQLQASPESAEPNCLRIVAELFARTYKDAIQPGQAKQKPNKLPQLVHEEAQLLSGLVTSVIRQRKYTFQRVLGLLKELALASVKSKWSFVNILKDRISSANEEKSTPANEWSQRATTQAARASSEMSEAFRFDPRVFADEDVIELREICTQHHVFPTKSRQPTPNEWRIIVGMMDGTIIHKAIPTFLKRCCDARQMAWIQTQIRDRAEGEIWARLPPSFIVYDHNQTSKRIIGQIRRDATRLKWPDDKLFRVLGMVKAAAYDKKKHSIHLFFFTKMDAANADGIILPYRNAKITMRNPDAELPPRTLEDDAMTGNRRVSDGLANDRYQAFHKARLTNVSRTMDIAALTEYLAGITENEIKIGIPLDAYGPESDWSQTWDFYATTPSCPKAIADINRIVWDGHHIWILHNPGQQAPPCHQCAKVGHQAAACNTPENEWINEHTLVVTSADMSACTMKTGESSEGENDWEHFLRLGKLVSTAPNENHKDEQKGTNAEDQHGNTDEKFHDTDTSTEGKNDQKDNDHKTAKEQQLGDEATSGTHANEGDSAKEKQDGDQAEPTKIGTATAKGKRRKAKKAEEATWITVGGNKSDKPSTLAQREENKSDDQGSQGTSKKNGKRTHTTRSSLGNVIVIEEEEKTEDSHEDTTENDSEDKNVRAALPIGATEDKEDKEETTKNGQRTDTSDTKHSSNTQSTGGNNHKSRSKQYNHQETEEEALQSAIKEVKLQRLTEQINNNAVQHADEYNRVHLLKKIDGALEHVTTKASKRWILNALDGMLTKTPQTGNCQYHASTEAVFQRDILSEPEEKQTAMVHHTILQKYALLVASEVIPGGEQIGTNLSAIVDGFPQVTEESRVVSPETRWKEYYRDVALSKSGVRDIIEQRLWGGHDTQRTLAMVRRRPVFNIREVDSRTAYVQYYYPWKTAAGTLTAKQAQPGLEEWLKAIKDDVERHKTAPLVLVLTGQHYQAVLFDKQRRIRDAKPTPVLKSPTLLDLWTNLPTVDELIAARRRPAPVQSTEEDGPTREELLLSKPQLEPADLVGVLGQRNWSTSAQHDVVAILVAEATNITELLAFAPDHEADEHSQGELLSTEEMELSDSSFENPTQRSDGTPSQPGSAQASQTSSQESTPATPMFPTSTGAVYQRQAAEMWSGVQHEWHEQYPGEIPPDLIDYDRLSLWAKTKPTMLLEAGRWATNPFTLLEHLKVADIKAWVEEKRQEYLVDRLTDVVETITDVQARNELREWLHTIKLPAQVNIRRGQLRNETRWAQLRIHATRFIIGPTALPFVKKEYSPTCAYVLVLDALFPEIPRLAFASSTSVELPPVIRMTDVFQYVPAFREAFARAVDSKSWEPIKTYFEFLLKSRDDGVYRN